MRRVNIKILEGNQIKDAELIDSQYCLEFKYQSINVKKEEIGRSAFFLLKEIPQSLGYTE